jgi:hypothetical protein
MKLHHATAFALIGLGWYLMVPPAVHKGSDSVESLEPPSQWMNPHSFDTAAACEDGLAISTKSSKEKLDNNPTDAEALRNFNWISDAECIASDDPQVKSK